MMRSQIILLTLAMTLIAAAPATLPTVGMEAQVEIDLPGTRLEAKPVLDNAPLLLRIVRAQPMKDSGRYDLRYIGLVPGAHDLKDYLVRVDGSALDNLPPIPVMVSNLLPPDHSGELARLLSSTQPRFGGYRALMFAAGAVWVLALLPLVIRKRRKVQMIEPSAPPMTLADRLRPLIERAADGELRVDEKASLERLLLGHWRDRLSLCAEDPARAIEQMRRHPQAGELLRSLENWLHRPPAAAISQASVAALLEPYRNVEAPPAIAST